MCLDNFNNLPQKEAESFLENIYPIYVLQEFINQRPFKTVAQIKFLLTEFIAKLSRDSQLELIKSYEINYPNKEEITNLRLNYLAKFNFPVILNLEGPRGNNLTEEEIVSIINRRLNNHENFELAENLRNIHRIAEFRINKKFQFQPNLGNYVWDWHERLAVHTDSGYEKLGQLTVTYLTDAHRACAQRISHWMKNDCGFDEVEIDAIGSVVGRYKPDKEGAKYLLTGSHYDTVRNGGKYDGRLGIFTPMAVVRELSRQKKRLPFGIEVVAFAEEEGQRYKASFLSSEALIGKFNLEWLEQVDASGISMRDSMKHAGFCIDDIVKIKRNPDNYLGFVEVHIEQGPVLNEKNLPLGIVTSINGSKRYACEIIGTASHAGTTPMNARHDAALTVAELALFMENRASQDKDSVATIGILQVPNGSTNVIPGSCVFSLDMRAPNDEQRDNLVNDILNKLTEICQRRGVMSKIELAIEAQAAPSDKIWQKRWEKSVEQLGIPVFKMPSGAGHDAMKIHEIMPQAMLFVRGQNAGISHNPLESTTSDDMQLAVEAFLNLLANLEQELS